MFRPNPTKQRHWTKTPVEKFDLRLGIAFLVALGNAPAVLVQDRLCLCDRTHSPRGLSKAGSGRWGFRLTPFDEHSLAALSTTSSSSEYGCFFPHHRFSRGPQVPRLTAPLRQSIGDARLAGAHSPNRKCGTPRSLSGMRARAPSREARAPRDPPTNKLRRVALFRMHRFSPESVPRTALVRRNSHS